VSAREIEQVRLQRMLLDYMRGNGCVLTVDGYRHLTMRGSFNSRSLSQVMAIVTRAGFIERIPPPYANGGDVALAVLTEAGKRA
jgi:hypothetical protein